MNLLAWNAFFKLIFNLDFYIIKHLCPYLRQAELQVTILYINTYEQLQLVNMWVAFCCLLFSIEKQI